ncbi:MAG: DUF1990 domain-containing protein [Actinomycetota bacterium]|nr:DUF1990 domain-containing protein [Actinomycetota bacterium]
MASRMDTMGLKALEVRWRPTPRLLASRLRRAEGQDLTYAEVGATDGSLPSAGYCQIALSTIVGSGEEAFHRLADALLRWELQRAAGLVVTASSAAVTPGCTVLNATPGRLALLAPCRVVYVLEGSRQRGFAYGTLPGHPLSGEELFGVELDAADHVILRIVSFSRPCGPARLAPGLARAGQRAVNRTYVATARRLAAGPTLVR